MLDTHLLDSKNPSKGEEMSSSCKGYVCLSPLMSFYVPRMIEKCDEKTDTLFGTEVHKQLISIVLWDLKKSVNAVGKSLRPNGIPRSTVARRATVRCRELPSTRGR